MAMTKEQRIQQDRKRQQALYEYLLRRGDKWTSMEQTTDSINAYPAFFTTNYHNSTTRRLLTSDIEAINNSEAYEKIIVSSQKGIKLASQKEFETFLVSEYQEIFKKLKRVRKMAKKGRLDQQQDLEGKITESFLRRD